MFLQLVANGLVTGAVLAIAAVGVSLIYGILGLVNFAYGDVMTFGAFVAVLCNGRLGMGMVVAAVLAMVATAILSLSLEGVLWRPLRARRAGFMSLFLASIGLALVLRQAIFLVAGPQPRSYDVDPYKVYVLGSVRLSGAQAIAVTVAAAAIVAVALVLGTTSVGRTMRAVADDRALASGALFGGLLLGLATEVSTWAGFHGGVNPIYKPVVAFAVLIAVLLVRPQGLLGRARTL